MPVASSVCLLWQQPMMARLSGTIGQVESGKKQRPERSKTGNTNMFHHALERPIKSSNVWLEKQVKDEQDWNSGASPQTSSLIETLACVGGFQPSSEALDVSLDIEDIINFSSSFQCSCKFLKDAAVSVYVAYIKWKTCWGWSQDQLGKTF